MEKHNMDVYYVPYIYAKDENGICVAQHWRETIIRKKPGIYWKKTIHENIFFEDNEAKNLLKDDRLKIIHNITPQDAEESYQRNIKALLKEFKKDKGETDPRTIAYIGRMLMGKGLWQEAVLFLENLTKRSGWDDDKYFAWIQMSQCYQQMNKLEIAIGCCNEALSINTKFPDAWLQMGAIYLNKHEYDKAVDWIMPGIVRPIPDTMQVVDPSFYGYKAKINAALALLGKGDVEMAYKYYLESKALAPKEPYILGHEKMFTDAYEEKKYLTSLVGVIDYTQKKDKSRVKNIIESMPTEIFKDERACAIRNNFMPPRTWGDKEIAIFCGQAWEDWSPVSILKGIGGSEEAVIYMSKELTKLGYKVTVFNTCGEMAGEYDGVEYKNYLLFNPKDNYSTLIAWRWNHFDGVNAKNKLVWLHDVPQESTFTPESVKSINKIIVLSEFHKSLLPKYIPEEKIFVSSNGINMDDFKDSQNVYGKGFYNNDRCVDEKSLLSC
jgi:tetratricopeptide (TPR) repeat protein